MSFNDGAFHRAPRPLIGWAGVVLVTICTLFVTVVLAAIGIGFWLTAARGQPVPDFTGGLAVLITALAPACGFIGQWMHTRSRERRDEIAFSGGQAAQNPTITAGPSPDGPRAGDS